MKTFFDFLKNLQQVCNKNNFLSLLKGAESDKIYYNNFLENISSFASYLVSSGLKKNDKVVIIMESSPSWLQCDLSIIKAGGVSVPMFANLSSDNMIYQFENCNAQFLCVDSEETFNIVIKTGFPFKKIFTLQKLSSEIIEKNKNIEIISIEQALKEGATKLESSIPLFEKIEKETSEDDVVTIIYTSGTSGRPKGVELTHKNLISQIPAIDVGYGSILNQNEDSVFSFLPLAHIFQRTVTYYFTSKGVTYYFSNNIKAIADDLEKTKPSAITVVPRFLEKVKNGLNEKLKAEKSIVKKIIGRFCYNYAIKHEPTIPHNKILYSILDKLMYSKIRMKLGGKLKAMISGGAALPDEIYRFFINVGIPLYQGYGLTETSPVVAVNTPAENKLYTIGRPLKDVEVKLTSEGELLVKGPNVMKGYHNIENTGARIIDEDGFLYTGDLASIDSEGYIKIIGRKKEQFKTSNGKFINPIKLESLLNTIPYVETSCVIAEGRPFVTAILFPSEAGALKFSEVEALIPEYIRQINEQLDRHEHIHYFHLHSKPASIESGQITPSMKIIRTAIEKQFTNEVKDFYSKRS